MNQLPNKKNILTGTVFTLLYLSISLYLINYHLILNTVLGNYPLSYKTSLLTSLAIGSIQILPGYEIILITITAFLVGINAVLISKLLKKIKDQGKLRLTTGGTSLLAVAGAGCPSCGVSVLSILGVSSSAIPLRGVTLQLITIGLLGISLYYNYRKLHQPESCKIVK